MLSGLALLLLGLLHLVEILDGKGIPEASLDFLIAILSIAAHHHLALLVLKDEEAVFMEEVEAVLGPAVDVKEFNEQGVCFLRGDMEDVIVGVANVEVG